MDKDFINIVKPMLPKVDYCSMRFVNKYSNIINVTRNVLEPIIISEDEGVMITVFHNGGSGYGATSNLTKQGIQQAINSAVHWAEFSKEKWLIDKE